MQGFPKVVVCAARVAAQPCGCSRWRIVSCASLLMVYGYDSGLARSILGAISVPEEPETIDQPPPKPKSPGRCR
jgi:hypothetical protein